MKNILKLVFISYLIGNQAYGQNLIPNHSFESINTSNAPVWCTMPSTDDQNCNMPAVDNWKKLRDPGGAPASSPGIFNTNAPYNPGEVFNAQDGNIYMGMFLWQNPMAFEAREYIQIDLSETLESGKDYTLSGYYRGVGCNKLGHLEWQFYSNNLGFNFSKDPLVQNSYQPIFLTPTANIDDVADDSQWYPFSLCFTAQGGENVLTIGDFYPSTDRNIQSVGCQPIGNHLFGSFVLVDNLVLEEAIGPFSSSPTVHYIQNKTYSQDETERGCSELHAGENVDASKVKGDVLITGGRNVNYYAKDLITLEDGFKIVDNDGVFVAQLVEACDNCYPDPYVAIDDPASGGRACKDRLETIQPINCGNSYTTSLLWSQTSGPPVSFQTPLSACTLQFIAPTAGTIVLRLTAFNSQGGSFYDDIEILVTPCADTRQGRGYTRGDQSRSANDGYDLVGTKSHTIEQINLYPNPVSDKMIIEGLNDGFESIQVSNYSGQVIYYSKTRSDKLDVGNLNPGIYLILIRQNDKVFTEKVVVE